MRRALCWQLPGASFSCWDHFLCMAFAQLTFRESLRDIVACLRSQERRLYHLGIRGTVSRSTLADANEARDWRIYADFAHILIGQARALYVHEELGLDLANTVYALDSTIIDLCMTLFPWARYKSTQNALKLHTLLDLRGSIPTFVRVTAAQIHDVNILDLLTPEAGAFYVMDRGYLDFERLYRWSLQGAFFVTRARKNFRFRRLLSHPWTRAAGCSAIKPSPWCGSTPARVIPPGCAASVTGMPSMAGGLIFLTNHFTLPALTITELYRRRWQIELFFKWIKQHLRIKAFYGTSENAVKTQIWIAVCSYLLVAIVRKRLNLPVSLYTMLQILSVSLFEKMPINQAFLPNNLLLEGGENPNQLWLLDF